jgi:DNA polymerase III epsilon subunit-like protein
MYLIFDTETTGLPTSRAAPPSDVDNWPRVVQLAWQTFDTRGKKTGGRSFVIRPDGFAIPEEAVRVHGISTVIAKRKGVPIVKALAAFEEALKKASVVVAHNFQYDGNTVAAEFYRVGIRKPFDHKTQVCTMEVSTEYCALPGRYGFKWPTLPELHSKLFRESARETHNAAADVAICSKCFFELKRLGIVRLKRKGHRARGQRRS